MAHVSQILALAFWKKSLKPFEVFPHRTTVLNGKQLPGWNKDWLGTVCKVHPLP